jgi:hypothetical protein
MTITYEVGISHELMTIIYVMDISTQTHAIL